MNRFQHNNIKMGETPKSGETPRSGEIHGWVADINILILEPMCSQKKKNILSVRCRMDQSILHKIVYN